MRTSWWNFRNRRSWGERTCRPKCKLCLEWTWRLWRRGLDMEMVVAEEMVGVLEMVGVEELVELVE